MEARTLTLGLAAVAVVAVATTNARQPAPSAVSGAAVEDTAPSGAGPQRSDRSPTLPGAVSGEDLLHSFFGPGFPSGGGDSKRKFSLRILIASVPDPYDSHLDWSYDATLEAIRRAFETSSYVTDRFWFPGPRDSVMLPRDTTKRVALREVWPGVMLFRHSNPTVDSLRLLYVVPELPTQGIHKDAIWAALQERSRLRQAGELPIHSDPLDSIRIVGPTFSGSARSLQHAIRAWQARERPDNPAGESVAIVSGSATDLANLEMLNCKSLRMHFSATINPDQSLDRLLANTVLPRLGIEGGQVALLRESSTQYGRSLLGTDTAARAAGDCAAPPRPPASGPGQRPRAAAGGPDTADTADAVDEREFVVIPFPMSISSLRSEYQRLPAGAVEPTGLPGAREPPRLPLELLDPSRPKEDLPVTSRLSPAALDLILEEVARTLTRRQIRMVGLLATDVRDKLFLGEEIRKRVRDVQFFTYESNVLYLRPDRNRSLRGMLVFSTYPLMLENQWAMSSSKLDVQRFAFGSDLAEGVFNATLLQLGNAPAMMDYRYGRGSRFEPQPPVWVTTVGNRTFLPVLRKHGEDLGYLASGCPPPRDCTTDPQWPRALPFLVLSAMLLASCGLGVLGTNSLRDDRKLRSSLTTSGITTDFQLRSLRDEVMAGSLKLHERLYTVLRVAAALGILLAAASPLLHPVRQWLFDPHRPPSLFLGLLAALASAAALCGVLAIASGTLSLVRLLRYLWVPGWRYFWQEQWTDAQEKWTWRLEVVARGIVALFGLMFLVLSFGFAADVWGLEPPAFWLFYRRAIEMDSMVSPILPLVLGGLGYAVWCSWHLERIALLRTRTIFEGVCDAECHTPWAPRITLASALRDDLLRTAAVVRAIRNRLFQVVPSLGALGVLVAFLCLGPWLWFRFGRSLEAILISKAAWPPSFDLLFRVMVMASMFATAWAAYRLLAVWDGLRQCLDGFARMPLISAFDRLPPRLARLTRLTLPGFSRITTAGGVADLQWLHLQRIYSARKDEFQAALHPLHADIAHRVDDLMKFPAERASALDTSGRRALVVRFEELHHVLRELWRLEPMSEDVVALVDAVRKDSERGDGGLVSTSMTQRIRRTFSGPVRLWLRAAEEYAASRMVEYLEWVIHHLRLLSLFMLISLLLTTMLISSYPYHPQSHLRLILLFVLVGSVGAVVAVMVQTNRNEVLSRIARTEPGRLTWDGTFVFNLFTFGVVPLLTLLSSEFPGLRNALFAWVQPLVSALAKQ